jgi:adenine-specific DNA glycosylase
MRLGIVRSGQKVALWERPGDAKFLGKCWGFLTGIGSHDKTYLRDGGPDSTAVNQALSGATPLSKKVKHSITHHQIEAQVVTLDASHFSLDTPMKWVPITQVEEALVSNLDRKAWKIFQTIGRPPKKN